MFLNRVNIKMKSGEGGVGVEFGFIKFLGRKVVAVNWGDAIIIPFVKRMKIIIKVEVEVRNVVLNLGREGSREGGVIIGIREANSFGNKGVKLIVGYTAKRENG